MSLGQNRTHKIIKITFLKQKKLILFFSQNEKLFFNFFYYPELIFKIVFKFIVIEKRKFNRRRDFLNRFF